MKQDDSEGNTEDHVEKFTKEEAKEGSSNFSQREDDPISQETDIVFFVSAFEGDEGKIGWDEVANDAGE